MKPFLYDYEEGLQIAAKNGSLKLVQWYMDKGATGWSLAFQRAAEGGHTDILQFFMDKGHGHRIWCWDQALEYAAKGGNKDLVQFLINKGAYMWYLGLHGAAKGGHIDLVKFFMDKDIGNADLNMALLFAAEGKHMHIVHYLLNKGADISRLYEDYKKLYTRYITYIPKRIIMCDYNEYYLQELIEYF